MSVGGLLGRSGGPRSAPYDIPRGNHVMLGGRKAVSGEEDVTGEGRDVPKAGGTNARTVVLKDGDTNACADPVLKASVRPGEGVPEVALVEVATASAWSKTGSDAREPTRP